MADLVILIWALGGLPGGGRRAKRDAALHTVKVTFSAALSVPAARLYRVAVSRSPWMSKTPIRAALPFPRNAQWTHCSLSLFFFFMALLLHFFFFFFLETEAAKTGCAGAKSSGKGGDGLAGPDRNRKPKTQTGLGVGEGQFKSTNILPWIINSRLELHSS